MCKTLLHEAKLKRNMKSVEKKMAEVSRKRTWAQKVN